MFMGGDSHSEGSGFESRHRILDGHFSHIFVVKQCYDVCLKRPKINDKTGRCWPTFFFKKNCIKFISVTHLPEQLLPTLATCSSNPNDLHQW